MKDRYAVYYYWDPNDPTRILGYKIGDRNLPPIDDFAVCLTNHEGKILTFDHEDHAEDFCFSLNLKYRLKELTKCIQ